MTLTVVMVEDGDALSAEAVVEAVVRAVAWAVTLPTKWARWPRKWERSICTIGDKASLVSFLLTIHRIHKRRR